ncbi:hypothetical protein OESDEN_15502 [Oesophagostomum dentatum]|uniref:Uncharacterized protein n=1 Tax=Oesophagostomum dentatum TaxID=61180 RepID=A0A0B1SNL2_OESDE|nr:hypothetical protein OESDEN_15502 [Oesophagostomum dentatum]
MQIEELLTEREVLLRTINLLPRTFEELKEKIESYGGTPLLSPPQQARPKIAPTTTDIEELREMVANLVHTVDQRREEMAVVKKKAADLQSVVNDETQNFQSMQADYESRRAEVQNGAEELKPLIKELEQREEKAKEALPRVEEQISEAEKQLSSFDEFTSSSSKAQLKDQIAEEQAQADTLMQNNSSQITDLNAARKQMQMWKGLVAMFEAKFAIPDEKNNLE